MADGAEPFLYRAGYGLNAEHVADLRDGFRGVEAQLHRDIVAMRDTVSPARFDDARLDAADAAFTTGFRELDAAIPADLDGSDAA